MKTILSLLLVIISLVGLADASYITYNEINNIVPPCTQNFNCEGVLQSQYAYLGPIPISALGIGYYVTFFILAILHFVEWQPKLNKHSVLGLFTPIAVLQLLSIGGLVFTLYLLTIMGIVLKVWCLYCLISALTSTLLFLITQFYYWWFSYSTNPVFRWLTVPIANWKYKHLFKPLFFNFDAKKTHDTLSKKLNSFTKNPLGSWLTRTLFSYNTPRLWQEIDGIVFPNPVGLAAGYDYDARFLKAAPNLGFGFQTIGTLTLKAHQDKGKPKLQRLTKLKSILVNEDFKNIGVKTAIKKLENTQFLIPIGISIASPNTEFATLEEQITDIVTSFYLFEKSNVKHSYYELNINYPNSFTGDLFTSPGNLEKLLTALDAVLVSKPIYIKMPIDYSEKETLLLLKVIDKHTIAGVIFGYLTNNKDNSKAELKEKGSLSGTPTFEKSNTLIALTKKHFKNRFTIIGTGGIMTPQDAEKKLALGADLVQLITGMIYTGPQLIGAINLHLDAQKSKQEKST